MRILQLKTSAGRGGAETLLLQTTRELVSRGHSIRTLVGEPGWLVDRLLESDLDAATLPLVSASGLLRVPRLVHEIKSWGADLVLSHGARVNVFGTMAARLSGRPSVSIEHSIDDWRTSGSVMDRIDRWVARGNRGRIAVSEAVGRLLIDRGILPPAKVDIIPNGVRFPDSVAALGRTSILNSMGINAEATVLVTVARFSNSKGHIHLIEALPQLVCSYPGLRCLLLGDGPLRADIEDRVQVLGLDETVVFAGAVDNVMELLPACDAFVLPSLWEGLPISVLEAMGLGVPVVASAVGGTPEVVHDGQTGLLVPPADPDALAAAIGRLLEDDALRNRISVLGRRYVRKHYNLDRVLDRYEEVLGRWLTT